jgi:hypothetical protein
MANLKFNFDEEREAYRASQSLGVIANVVLVFSIIGLGVLLITAFTPTCPIIEPDCSYESDKDLYNLWLAPIAVAQLLVAMLVTAFARAFAASVRLQALISLENT